MNIPKHLVEIDHASLEFEPRIPTRPLWVVRTRDPFCLARIEAGGALYESAAPAARVQLWPAVIDVTNRDRLLDGMVRALFREHDLYPGHWGAPVFTPNVGAPPEFLHVLRPESNFELILEPHAPRLWKVILAGDDAAGAEHIRGWGIPPEFPHDTRRVAAFLEKI